MLNTTGKEGSDRKGDARVNRRGRPKNGRVLTDILNYQLDRKNGNG
jgi:hypothetical protein